jgi:GNAT superfamily N-acetyltransferase
MTALRALEQRALSAWPCLRQVRYDGWLLRYAAGYTRRANSVVPLCEGRLDVERKVRACEGLYARWRLPPVFKVLPFIQPSGLDGLLDGKGYAREAETCVQVCDLDRLTDLSIEREVMLWEEPDDLWLDAHARCSGAGAAERPQLRAILARIAPARCFVALLCGGLPVSCGIGVCDDGYVGLFCVATEAQQRNRGFGRQLIGWIARWGRSIGAERAYLQVVAENGPARHLYARLGFREAYRYWYRIKDSEARHRR